MTNEQIKLLLAQEESATLEFKSEPYWIDHKDEKTKSRQRDELIKDILALTNGNSIVAGDTAYLIIGADDKRDEDGHRPIYDIGENNLTTRRILDIINPACSPKLEGLDAELVEVDGKRLNVITINPSPHLHETTRKLTPSAKGSYTEFVVFVRHNESIHIASGKERDAIAKLKKLRFNEIKNPPAEPFGAIVGGIIGAVSFAAMAEKVLGKQKGAQAGGAIAGVFFGGSLGFMMGNTFKSMVDIRSNWNRSTPERNFIAVVISSFFMLISFVVLRFFSKRKKKTTDLPIVKE